MRIGRNSVPNYVNMLCKDFHRAEFTSIKIVQLKVKSETLPKLFIIKIKGLNGGKQEPWTLKKRRIGISDSKPQAVHIWHYGMRGGHLQITISLFFLLHRLSSFKDIASKTPQGSRLCKIGIRIAPRSLVGPLYWPQGSVLPDCLLPSLKLSSQRLL